MLAHTTKLLQAEAPYLQDIEGIKTVPYLKQLEAEVAHKLDVFRPIKDYLSIDGEVKFEGIDDAVINLRVVSVFSLRVYLFKWILSAYFELLGDSENKADAWPILKKEKKRY